jgi:hypothetical protein
VVDGRWGKRIAELIEPPSRLLSTSVFEIIAAEGFTGSYPSVVRAVRDLRGPRFRPAPQVSVPIETTPGEEILCGIPHRHSYGAPVTMRRGSDLVCIRAGRRGEGADPRRIIPRPTSAHKLSPSMIERRRQCHWNGKVRWLRGPPGSLRR